MGALMATVAKPAHVQARQLLLAHLDIHPGKTVGADLDPAEAGIVGDPAHAGGYHRSRQDIPASDYSVRESPRDRRGRSDTASATDLGFFKVTTSRGTFDLYDYNAWLIPLCKAGDPDTTDLREVIYSPDGKVVRRWDRLGTQPNSGPSSHLTHTHESEFREADGHRMVNLAARWLQHIGLLAGRDDDMEQTEKLLGNTGLATRTVGNVLSDVENLRNWEISKVGSAAGQVIVPEAGSPAQLMLSMAQAFPALVAQVGQIAGKDFTDEPAIVAGVLAGLDPTAIAAAIPEAMAQQVADLLAARLAS